MCLGIGYSVAAPAANSATYENALLPDINYTTTTRIEDLPYNKQKPITTSLKAIYVPHDYSTLNLKNPLSSSGTEVPQRLFILIQSGPANQIGVARITVSTNWEGTPGPTTQDFIRPSVAFGEILSREESKFKLIIL